jgi:hypothetical protein
VVLFATGVADSSLSVFGLKQNTPNPFNPATTISYVVPAGGADVRLEIFDLRGRRVRTLVDCFQIGGPQSVRWHGLSDEGERVPSGVYFYRLAAAGQEDMKKMLLLK